MPKRNLGGERLGTGQKTTVEMKGFPRSKHNLGYVFKSTQAPGTLVPFLSKVMLPGDTAEVDLRSHILTLPTTGPLFGSFKVQYDLFKVPWRLYNSWVHNNIFDIGEDVSKLKIPKIRMTALPMTLADITDIDNSQINPSCLLSYLGIRGIGVNEELENKTRDFNAIPILGYWDIVKHYYSNLQEGIGAVIHTTEPAATATITGISIASPTGSPIGAVDQAPAISTPISLTTGYGFAVSYSGATPDPDQIYITFENNGPLTLNQLSGGVIDDVGTQLQMQFRADIFGTDIAVNWNYVGDAMSIEVAPNIETFSLENIDDMRMAILAFQNKTAPYIINNLDKAPYKYLYEQPNGMPNSLKSQEGLALKTYLSDRNVNYLDETFRDYINTISQIDTSGGSFNMEQLLLSERIYEHYSRIMVSGGSYEDWQEVTYDIRQAGRPEMPIYVGGASAELEFQSVISQAQTDGQPLGTLAGRGQLTNFKGGHAKVKFNEICYLMGIVSFTPRVDYSQGNTWDTVLDTWDDLHKPIFDGIGFQELPTQELAWWDTKYNAGTTSWEVKSAGVQPAWIHYMTSVNRTYGSFAEQNNQMFMTLNRRYQWDGSTGIEDLTTYVDPAKYQYIFAQQSLSAQNFWTQIGVGLSVTRVMSPKVMPMF